MHFLFWLYIQADGNITIFRVPDEKSQTAIYPSLLADC
ncbi:hypothetical protein D1BOALGB6SA_1149 [Olavius sp. associated proteobacterium Delta 1]|nr:hypothetical protein D1BOALGB6SA_1149 [Olavius sp. associated proteobacterium Delta 1]